jgi:hypothetical protein
MRRWLFRVASWVSLLCCIGTAVLWGLSFIQPGAGFNWLRVDEGNDYVFLRNGRLEEWINTPWDGKWYGESSLPLWVPASVFLSIAVAIRLAPRFLRKSRFAGLCLACGYNLTGNTSGTCPECGTPVPKEPNEKSPRPA